MKLEPELKKSFEQFILLFIQTLFTAQRPFQFRYSVQFKKRIQLSDVRSLLLQQKPEMTNLRKVSDLIYRYIQTVFPPKLPIFFIKVLMDIFLHPEGYHNKVLCLVAWIGVFMDRKFQNCNYFHFPLKFSRYFLQTTGWISFIMVSIDNFFYIGC